MNVPVYGKVLVMFQKKIVMKKLWILFAILGVSTYLVLSENDKKERKHTGKHVKNKFKKSHFPKQEVAST
jgi:hypothetical protein